MSVVLAGNGRDPRYEIADEQREGHELHGVKVAVAGAVLARPRRVEEARTMASDPNAERIGLSRLAAPVSVGLALRVWNLREQIVGDDELHAVRAAISMPLDQILVTWQQTDHSLPLTALYRLWLDAGGVLSESVLRAPALLGSLALLLVAPRLLAPLAGARVAWLWAWLLALSPMLVIYGRMVRSYSITVALTTCAVLAFARYGQGGGRRFGAVYVLCGAFAIFFHLGAGPVVVAPLGAGLLAIALQPRLVAFGLPGIAWLAVGLLLTAGMMLAPGLDTLAALVGAKSGVGGLDLSIAWEVMRLHAGSAGSLVALGFWAVVAAGPVELWRRGQLLLALLVPTALLGHVAGLLVLAPELDSPILATRAFLVTLPMSLLGAAAGIDGVLARWRVDSGGRRAAALGCLAAALLWAGPYLDGGFWRSSFRQHDDYILFTRERPAITPATLPSFYRELGQHPEGELVELPWHPFWGFGHAIPAYQEHHRRAVVVANSEPLARDPRVALQRYVLAEPAALLASGGRYAILHLDLELEERTARAARGRPDETRPHPKVWRALRREARRARQQLDAAWGPADYDDGVVVVWDLARVRSS